MVEELRQATASSTACADGLVQTRRLLQPKTPGQSLEDASSFGVNDELPLSRERDIELMRSEDLQSSGCSDIVLESQPPHHPSNQHLWNPDAYNDSLHDNILGLPFDTPLENMSFPIPNDTESFIESAMLVTDSRQDTYQFGFSPSLEDEVSFIGSSAIQGDLTNGIDDQSLSSWHSNISSFQPSMITSTPSIQFHSALSPQFTNVDSMENFRGSHIDTLNLLQVDDTQENRKLLRTALDQKHTIGSIFLAGLRSISGPPPPVPITPDLYSNHLSLQRLSTLHAYLSNATALSFHVPSLMEPDAPSPFYRPEITTASAASSYISRISDFYPVHLRPTPPQILHPHLPFIDLLPFPTLRARAITLANVTPPLFDLLELKIDILNDGLICWGGTDRKGGQGQPWDMRTWEAAGWFIKKWWILVGAEGEEIREGARWWRRLRGEESMGRVDEVN